MLKIKDKNKSVITFDSCLFILQKETPRSEGCKGKSGLAKEEHKDLVKEACQGIVGIGLIEDLLNQHIEQIQDLLEEVASKLRDVLHELQQFDEPGGISGELRVEGAAGVQNCIDYDPGDTAVKEVRESPRDPARESLGTCFELGHEGRKLRDVVVGTRRDVVAQILVVGGVDVDGGGLCGRLVDVGVIDDVLANFFHKKFSF